MKLISAILIATILLFSFQKIYGQSQLESGIKIPVYPGAAIDTEREPGESAMCCNFVSKDGFEKVIAFYENSLKLKSLDINGLETQLPFLKPQTEMMKKEMPAGMKFRVFVLKVVEFQGQKGAELFEVYSSPKGVEFSIMESQLTEGDSHFISDSRVASQGTRGRIDPQIMVAALPSSGPAGYEKGELNIDESENNPANVNTGYRKLVKKGTGGGEDGSNDVYSEINITISQADKEFFEEMLKPQANNEKSVMVKGKYRGLERTEKNEYGCVGAEVYFVVNNKFLVEISESFYCDPKLIYQVIDKMNLEILPK